MSDLVERLRARAPYYTEWASDIRKLNGASVDADHADATARDLREAADALEREQKALRRIADNYEDGATLSGTQCAEIAAEAMSAIYVDEEA